MAGTDSICSLPTDPNDPRRVACPPQPSRAPGVAAPKTGAEGTPGDRASSPGDRVSSKPLGFRTLTDWAKRLVGSRSERTSRAPAPASPPPTARSPRMLLERVLAKASEAMPEPARKTVIETLVHGGETHYELTALTLEALEAAHLAGLSSLAVPAAATVGTHAVAAGAFLIVSLHETYRASRDGKLDAERGMAAQGLADVLSRVLAKGRLSRADHDEIYAKASTIRPAALAERYARGARAAMEIDAGLRPNERTDLSRLIRHLSGDGPRMGTEENDLRRRLNLLFFNGAVAFARRAHG